MVTKVHNSILNSKNRDKTGLVLSPELIASAVVDQISTTINENYLSQKLGSGVENVYFIIDKASTPAPANHARGRSRMTDNNGRLEFSTQDGIQIEGRFVASANDQHLTDIYVDIPSLNFFVELSYEGIEISNLDIVPDAKITPVANREVNTNLTADELKRLDILEKWITEFGSASFVRMFVEPSFNLDFNRLLPSLSISGPLETEVHEDHLVIFPTDLTTIRQNVICPNYDATTGSTVGRSAPPTIDRNEGTASWDLDVTGLPSPPSKSALRRATDNLGQEVGIFMPNSVIQSTFTRTFPAVTTRLKGRGLVRYDGHLTAKLEKFEVSVDTINMAIETYVELGAHANINFTAKIECVGSVDIGWGKAETIEPLKLWLRTTFEYENGDIVGKTYLRSMKAAKFDAKIELFSRYLSWFGGYWIVLGYALDLMAGEYIETEATKAIRKKVKQVFNSNNFTLFDLGALEQYFAYGAIGTFSGDADSVILGAGGRD